MGRKRGENKVNSPVHSNAANRKKKGEWEMLLSPSHPETLWTPRMEQSQRPWMLSREASGWACSEAAVRAQREDSARWRCDKGGERTRTKEENAAVSKTILAEIESSKKAGGAKVHVSKEQGAVESPPSPKKCCQKTKTKRDKIFETNNKKNTYLNNSPNPQLRHESDAETNA
jgi:hypothetical protein